MEEHARTGPLQLAQVVASRKVGNGVVRAARHDHRDVATRPRLHDEGPQQDIVGNEVGRDYPYALSRFLTIASIPS